MRRLKRTQQRHLKTTFRFSPGCAAAGAAATISLASQTGLADREDLALGHEPFGADENDSGIADFSALLAVLGLPAQCGHPGTTYSSGDLNHDCKVNVRNLVESADVRLTTTGPAEQ